MRTIPILDATAPPGVVFGRHAIWAPQIGIKVPFQWGGLATKYQRREAAVPLGESLAHEIAILRSLAAEGMAPTIGEPVFVETLISEHPGGWHADPCGAYGYGMADATQLPPGRFSLDRMRQLPIVGSDGAWGDVMKPGNVVNGYLVDVRRSAFDMLRWTGGDLFGLARDEGPADLALEVHRRCQFPAGARAEAYQDFYLAGHWQRGQRRVVERAQLLGFAPAPGEVVLEIGCQSGGFLQLAALAGAEAIGVEVDGDYVDCARRLAGAAAQNICVRQLDAVAERDVLLAWVRQRWPRGIDHLLLLSMEKHLGEAAMFDLIDAIGARTTYVETNAVSATRPWKLRSEVEARGGHHVGDSTDRNQRRLYRIERGQLTAPQGWMADSPCPDLPREIERLVVADVTPSPRALVPERGA